MHGEIFHNNLETFTFVVNVCHSFDISFKIKEWTMASRRVFIDARTYISMISAFAKVSSYKPPSFFPKYAQKLMQQIVQI